MMRHLIRLVALVSLALVAACARQGYPTGGPKDTAPPVALACTPLNESRNFSEKEFSVQFDEYVVLKNAANNVSRSMSSKARHCTSG